MSGPRFLLVEWLDSAEGGGTLEPHELPEPYLIQTVGILAAESEEFLTLAQDLLQDGRWRTVVTIPRCAITEVRELL